MIWSKLWQIMEASYWNLQDPVDQGYVIQIFRKTIFQWHLFVPGSAIVRTNWNAYPAQCFVSCSITMQVPSPESIDIANTAFRKNLQSLADQLFLPVNSKVIHAIGKLAQVRIQRKLPTWMDM